MRKPIAIFHYNPNGNPSYWREITCYSVGPFVGRNRFDSLTYHVDIARKAGEWWYIEWTGEQLTESEVRDG